MPVDEKIQQALDLKSLALPPTIPVIGLEVEDYTDWTGDPALRVQVILDESLDIEKVTGEAVGDLKSAIHDSLINHGIRKQCKTN